MARILFESEWYEQVAPTAFYEYEFENIIKSNAGELYPDFHLASFKCLVNSENGSAKPDFVLIDKRYRNWWVVEVEMVNHSLDGHVIPQVKTLRDGIYGDEHASKIREEKPSLELNRLKDMMKGSQPRILVVINCPMNSWISKLEKYDAYISIFEIFRSKHNKHLFRVNGYTPKNRGEILSKCHFDRVLPNFLLVESPAAIPVNRGETIRIYYESYITEWKRIDSEDSVWLYPSSDNPLPRERDFIIQELDNGELKFEEKENEEIQ